MFSKILKTFNKNKPVEEITTKPTKKPKQMKSKITASRIGELGEYKINIQLDQLPKGYKYLSDVLIPNDKARSGYSQIDHIIFTSYAIFVVETKNYSGTIYGDRSRAKWSVNGKFPMMNPFNQNFGHIQAIKAVLGTNDDRAYVSIVSFTKRCTFKVNVELRKIQSNDLIVYDTELSEYITRKLSVLRLQHQAPLFPDDDMLHMYNKLKNQNIIGQDIRESHVEMLKTKKVETTNENTTSVATCVDCGKTVSGKVKAFCFAKQERFKGKIYCYEHQKPHL